MEIFSTNLAFFFKKFNIEKALRFCYNDCMKIVIIGAGFTGVQLAKRLINEGNDVYLIDNDEDTINHYINQLDCTLITADGNNMETLEDKKVGIATADALVTLTEDDEINMITCSMVDSVYPDLLKIARVRNYAYYVNTSEVVKKHADTFSGKHRPLYGIDFMIHPDIEAAEAIVKAVEHGAVSDIVTFGDKFELAALEVNKGSAFDSVALKDLRKLADFKFIVVFVESGGVSALPFGDSVLKAGDRIGLLTETTNLPRLLPLCGVKADRLRKIVMVGAGRIGTNIADHLIEKNKKPFYKKFFDSPANSGVDDFVIVDSNKERSKAASERFPTAKVLCCDITDENMVREEGLDKFDLLIAATHNHEMNMIISAYMESLGVEKTIALVAQSQFADIARKLGVEVPIPLRDTIVDSIMSHLHGKNVTGIHTVSSGAFELVECDLPSSSKFLGKALKDIAKPGEYLLLLIKKIGASDYEIPGGNTVLSAGDHLVLIEKTGDKKVLERFSS